MVKDEFPGAGNKVIIEERLSGPEVSFMFFCDGKQILPLELAQDYKRRFDNDLGPNTGGMGAFSPVKIDPKLKKEVLNKIVELVVAATEFTGILYVGLMIVNSKPYVLEFNVRLGDPEAQVLLSRLKTDILELMLQGATGKITITKLDWSKKKAVAFVLVTRNYPSPDLITGQIIYGIPKILLKNALVFYAGAINKNGKILVNGGRVLNIVGLGWTFQAAINNALKIIKQIHFTEIDFRSDIGKSAN